MAGFFNVSGADSMKYKLLLGILATGVLFSFTTGCPSFAEDWQISTYAALAPIKTLQIPSANCQVTVVMKTNASGRLDLYAIGQDGPPAPAAVKAVENIVRKIQATIPPPVPAKKFATFGVFFDGPKGIRFGGPFAFDEIPEDIQLSAGLKKKSYELQIKDKLPCPNLSVFPYSTAKTVSKVKLSKSGSIEKISISAPDPAAQKFVYDIVGRGQPFPPVPAQFAKSPNFDIIISWERLADGPMRGSGSFSIKVKHLE